MSDEKLTIEHVRRSDLPWRIVGLTECGHPIESVSVVLSHEDLQAKVKQQGKQRAQITTCQTCWSTCQRWWADWDRDPCEVLSRYTNPTWGRKADTPVGQQSILIRKDLAAIALLIENHRDEFEELIVSLDSTTDLAERRQARRAQRGWSQP